MTEGTQPFIKTFDKIAYGKSQADVFNDYLDMVICVLSAGKYEEEYLSIVKRYKKEDVNLLCELFARMILIMDDNGRGLKDCLGEFYQLNLSNRRNGEFFTPYPVADFMAQIIAHENTSGKTIIDPCCGSGIMLLGAAKVSRNNYFYGADISHTSCKMCAINMCLNGLQGEVAWMNSLSREHWGGYTIGYTYAPACVPTITKLPAGEGIIINSPPFNGAREAESHSKQTKVITVTQAKFNFE